ncbi:MULTISPECIES: DUF6174 domain-containing protein [Idiomarina]|uniref:DUF6174 domain-containing protein n=1 Tax=Idiomarina TaxID=135575 RepID=UPI000C09090A|nr:MULTISPECIES: DUF6174 domain-containing protein [Idiomarina]MAL83873.1 hypothetical protein [Idiomarina sp.]MBP59230.1 hypothetical protein [Idiomarina sp.]|tara:strand:+ start:4401 stop:4931 length:531 start_codon:yes stop_codon:yes gene_type:complete
MIKFLIVVFSTVLLASCGESKSESDSETSGPDPKIGQVQEDLTAAKKVWQDNGLIDYTFNFYSLPGQECMPEGVVVDPLPHRIVTVEDNEVVYVENGDSGEPMEISTAGIIGTIDDVFDYLEQKLSEKPAVISEDSNKQNELPVFNESFGYPESFYLRIDHDDGCDATYISLSQLR